VDTQPAPTRPSWLGPESVEPSRWPGIASAAGLTAIAVGFVAAAVALDKLIWFAFPQPDAPMTLGGMPYVFEDAHGFLADYMGNLPWVMLLASAMLALLAQVSHRSSAVTGALAVVVAIGGLVMAWWFVRDAEHHWGDVGFSMSHIVGPGPYLAMAGYGLIGIGGAIGAIRSRSF
jgi:hypothetical protein